jgi:hypothetical protein
MKQVWVVFTLLAAVVGMKNASAQEIAHYISYRPSQSKLTGS